MKRGNNGHASGLRRAGDRVLITGGAGFIGTNLANRLMAQGRSVTVFDNFSRPGVGRNLRWLRETHGDRLKIEVGDICDAEAVGRAVTQASEIFHFAAQVAVTSSLSDPIHDFEVNARGTLNLLEALRKLDTPPPMIFTSSNKVYGRLEDVPVQATDRRYEPVDRLQHQHGFNEERPLDFHSPYGCSKGAAEQYVLDFSRTFGLPTAVFRMSCIYGPHQFGTEDQGWVAHFLIRALEGEIINVYGDGKQVRDILYVEDLVDAMLLAQRNINAVRGQAFNIGGGAANTVSLLELADLIGAILSERPKLRFAEWRAADQRFYVSDIRRFREATGWSPEVNVRAGVTQLYQWLVEFRSELHCARSRLNPAPQLAQGRAGGGVVLSQR
jgi:CDP-paratose 2-epimerase